MKKLRIIASIVVLVTLIAVASNAYASGFGRSVKINFAYSIYTRDNDTLHQSTYYISSQNNGVVLSLIDAGAQSFGNTLNSTYSATNYMLTVKQALDNNRFLLVFTNGTWENINNKINEVRNNTITGKQFGVLDYITPSSLWLFLRLEYDNIDILNNTRWFGSGKLVMINNGTDSRNVHKIIIDMK